MQMGKWANGQMGESWARAWLFAHLPHTLDLGDKKGDDFTKQGQAVVQHVGFEKCLGSIVPALAFAGRTYSHPEEVQAFFATKSSPLAFFDVRRDRTGTADQSPGNSTAQVVLEQLLAVPPADVLEELRLAIPIERPHLLRPHGLRHILLPLLVAPPLAQRLSPFTDVPICRFAHLSICPFAHLPICPFAHLPILYSSSPALGTTRIPSSRRPCHSLMSTESGSR
jgi:hypothetical protein